MEPIVLESITSDAEFMGAANLLAEPALEGFFSALKSKDKDMSEFGYKAPSKIIQYLIKSCYDWSHKLSVQSNQIISRFFEPNEVKAKILTADLKKLKVEAKKLKTLSKDRKFNEEQLQGYKQAYEETVSEIDGIQRELNDLARNVYLTPEIYQAFTEAREKSYRCVKSCLELLTSYKNSVDNFEKGMKYGSYINEITDRFDKEMDDLKEKTAYGSEFNETLTQDIQDIHKLCASKIDGHLQEPNLAIDSTLTVRDVENVVAVYQQFKTTMKWVNKRLTELRRDAELINKKVEVDTSYNNIMTQLAFITSFLTFYGDSMVAAFQPYLSIANSKYQK